RAASPAPSVRCGAMPSRSVTEVQAMNHAIRITCAVVLAQSGASAQVVRTVVQNGPSDELYDMVFLGDGYTAADQAQFDQDVIAVVDHFRNTPDKFPYGAYFGLYNVHSVFRASNQ